MTPAARLAAAASVLDSIAHGGADPDTLARLEGENQVVFRYLDDNPNGSLNDIAGITNARGNVVGLMPHPEHSIDPLTGPTDDGLGLFYSVLDSIGVSA